VNKTHYFPKEIDEKKPDNMKIEEELPNTLKKIAPKINSSKLPSAFSSFLKKKLFFHCFF